MKTIRLLSAFIGVTTLVSAQSPTARITGHILDPAGAAVAGAAVKTVNTETGVATSTIASSSGVYELLNLIP